MSHRPLAIVSGLTIGDYLLWNWSLNANHDVLALVSGLTLPPMTIALVWLLALTAARLIARGSRRSAHGRPGARAGARTTRPRWRRRRAIEHAPSTAAVSQAQQAPSAPTTSPRTSRKIAA